MTLIFLSSLYSSILALIFKANPPSYNTVRLPMSRLRPDHVGLKYFYIFPSKKNHLPIGEMIDGTLISENTPSAFKIVDRDVFVNIYTVINKKRV